MNQFTEELIKEGMPASYVDELDQIVAGGWTTVLDRVRTTSIRLLEIMANIHTHRKSAMELSKLQETGLMSFNVDEHIDDFVMLITPFTPCDRSAEPCKLAKLCPSPPHVRETFPSDEMLSEHLGAIENALRLTVDAVEIFVERPGMPTPCFDELVSSYIELARLQNLRCAMGAAASEELSSTSYKYGDLFGVGEHLAETVATIVPLRCVPAMGRISLPRGPSLDQIIAAYLLSTCIMRTEVSYEFVDDSFDASQTNTTDHGTIAAGQIPHHDPDSLCFDNRAVESSSSNTELVIEHAKKLGIPMDFTDGLTSISVGEDSGKFRFEIEAIRAIFTSCDTPSLAMAATRLLLTARVPKSEAYKNWASQQFRDWLSQDPEYLRNEPKFG